MVDDPLDHAAELCVLLVHLAHSVVKRFLMRISKLFDEIAITIQDFFRLRSFCLRWPSRRRVVL